MIDLNKALSNLKRNVIKEIAIDNQCLEIITNNYKTVFNLDKVFVEKQQKKKQKGYRSCLSGLTIEKLEAIKDKELRRATVNLINNKIDYINLIREDDSYCLEFKTNNYQTIFLITDGKIKLKNETRLYEPLCALCTCPPEAHETYFDCSLLNKKVCETCCYYDFDAGQGAPDTFAKVLSMITKKNYSEKQFYAVLQEESKDKSIAQEIKALEKIINETCDGCYAKEKECE